jgi:phosphohistidine swiveling domain-containing protein
MAARAQLLKPLDGSGTDAHLVGGKGAWLDKLAAGGFPVPVAIAITTDAYRAVAAKPEVAALLSALMSAPIPAAADLAEAERRVDEAFLGVDLPTEMAGAIAEGVARCRSTPETRLAARSSATAEDMTAASFAGQYRSFLNLQTDADVDHAIRRVWASLWYPAPRAYRRFHGVDESELAMAIVLMPMVSAERAGVAFTVDPTDSADMVRVETVQGLGEQLVSGLVTPDVALVPRAELSTGSRTAEREGEDSLAMRVAELALDVERTFGAPQDIEWAWDGESLQLLQARPITTTEPQTEGDGFDTVSGPDQRWTTAGISETLPGILPPLLWDTSAFLAEESFRGLFDSLNVWGDLPPGTHMIGRFRARAALNLGLLEEMALALPGGSPQEVEWQYFGRSAGERPATEATESVGRRAGARHDIVVMQLNRRANREAETVIIAVAQVLRSPLTLDGSLAELLQVRRKLLDLAGRAAMAETAVAAGAVAAYRRLEGWLTKRLERRTAERWAQRLTSSTVSGLQWPDFAAGPRQVDPDLAIALAGAQTWAQAEAMLTATAQGASLRDEILDRARLAGSASVFAGPTWDEDLSRVWTAVRAGSSRGQATDLGPDATDGPSKEAWAALQADLEQSPKWGRKDALVRQVFDVRLVLLRRLIEDSNELLDRRERTKSAVLSLGGEVRRVHLEIGRRLTGQGVLESPEDVHLLGEAELCLARTGGSLPSLAEVAHRRRWLERCGSEAPLPPIFQGEPARTGMPVAQGATEFHGWGASPGVFSGSPAVLADSGCSLDRGSVLIAQTTDASWSPLFLLAGAIVVEQGGPLSHAAIVSRELGIPAVLNVPGVAAAVADGDAKVTVDGDRGVVVIS